MKEKPEISNIYFSEKAFHQFGKVLNSNRYNGIFVLVDENTHDKCLPFFLQSLPELSEYEVLEIESGETSKSAEILVQLWEVLSEFKADRKSLIVNLGGGVVTDLGGFLAATYMRGIDFVNFPTSLLAMADAAAGSKTGINLAAYKNRVGAFAEAKMVGIVPEFLESLPREELMSGLAEMFKHGLIANPSHFNELAQLRPEHPFVEANLLRETIHIKESITRKDPRESGLRKVLNFGHTVGHALESHSHESGKVLTHGHAVALGMLVELELSVQYTGLSRAAADEAQGVLRRFYPWPKIGLNEALMLKFMQGDKKNDGQALHFTLLKEIGLAVYDVVVPANVVLEKLREIETH